MKVELIITGDTSDDQDLKALFAYLGGPSGEHACTHDHGKKGPFEVPKDEPETEQSPAKQEIEPEPEPDPEPVTHAVVRNAARDLYKKTGVMTSVVDIIKEFVPEKANPQVSDIAEEDLPAALARINEHDAIG